MGGMGSGELLIDLFGRVAEHVHDVLDGLAHEHVDVAPGDEANPIGWLLWHLARVEDAQVAELAGVDQVWTDGAWPQRFGVPPDPTNTGYGHTPAEVATIRPESVAALGEYYDAVAARTRELLERTMEHDLDRVVDVRWDPPVTMGARLISIADDCIQHAGQASYVRGLLEHR
jgi:hypothetical protein